MQVIEEFMSLADGQAVLQDRAPRGEEDLHPIISPATSSSNEERVSGGFGPASCSMEIPGSKSARV